MNFFLWKMAWRDSRRSRGRLVVFSSALTLGVAALVAIGSLGRNLERAIDDQARGLVGADLVLEARQPLDAAGEAFVRGLGGRQARETRLASMAEFAGGSRLAQVRAMEGDFPFYGAIETAPAGALAEFRAGRGALVEESLRLQYGIKAGDEMKIGGQAFRVLGSVLKLPGEANAFASLAPRVLLPLGQLPVALTSRGSLVRNITYLRLPDGTEMSRYVRALKPALARYRLEAETVDQRKRQLGRVFENVRRFLSLVGFVSLLLGGIGVASAIQAHLKQKQRTVAVLRCLGASSRQTLAIYLLQALALGVIGSTAGALAGVGIQLAVTPFLASVLPVTVQLAVSWRAVAEGLGVGLGACALFTLIPLLPIRRVPPLLALRAAFDAAAAGVRRHDPLLYLAYGLLAAALIAFPWLQSRDMRLGLGFSAGLFVAFGLLGAVAYGVIAAARRFFPGSWPFEWRQGFANLYRPNNRTLLLVFTLGLSTFLLLGLHLTKEALLHQFAAKGDPAAQPNLIFFDVQPDQVAGLGTIVRDRRLPVLGVTPVITMRLAALKGRAIAEVAAQERAARNRRQPATPEWRLRHEYRSTYRDRLTDTEEIVAGQFQGRPPAGQTGADAASAVPISLEAEAGRELKLRVGDAITFDVGGIPLHAVVGSLRKVDWSRFSPNFFVVFPAGVLEDAPTFNVLATRTPSAAASASLQGEVVRRYPTVSAIDLSLVAATIQSIVDKATAAVRFLSAFTVGTGLLVLCAAIFTGRYERIKEGVLLRTLGASRRQIVRILWVEYLCLGTLAAFTGILLAAAGSWALAAFVFKTPWAPAPGSMLAAWGLAVGLTLLAGLSASRGVCNHPPLEILRGEE